MLNAESRMVKIKICGIRLLEDAQLATELGASALGFIFWPSSPRFIDPYRARPIVAALPPFVTAVGVFVNQPWECVTEVARLLGLGAVQLHGDEPAEMYARSAYRVIKAVPVSGDDRMLASRVAAVPGHTTVLLDAHDPIKRGGTGRPIDWTQAAAVARTRRVILSGGLNADNVSAAIEAVNPYAIDVSSGVESAPGIKDATKMRALFEAAFRAQEARHDSRERAHGNAR
jgi:phosphoribosylanthranilate isomerase